MQLRSLLPMVAALLTLTAMYVAIAVQAHLEGSSLPETRDALWSPLFDDAQTEAFLAWASAFRRWFWLTTPRRAS